jgi:enoyl-CoA hydratase/carnithine racemase
MTTLIDDDLLTRGGVRLEVEDAVATVTLDRPAVRNAQTPSMWAALEHVGATLPDPVRVVVLRGAGRSFSAGLDLRLVDGRGIEGERDIPSLLAGSDEEIDAWIARCQAGFTWLRDPRFFSVAVLQGHAFGAGFQLALSCDFRIGLPDLQLCMKEAALGLVPDLTGTKPLVELVGYSRALDIVATARVVEAKEALDSGLVNEVVPADGVEEALATVVGRLTTPAAGAVRGAKQLLQAATDNDLHAQRALERQVQIGRLRELAALLGR